jgi:hypothetical protein
METPYNNLLMPMLLRMSTQGSHCYCLASRMYPCFNQRKSEIDSNRPKHGGDQEESPPVPERKAAV